MDYYCEFIAAGSGNNILRICVLFDNSSGSCYQPVAELVTEAVIDRL
ncbi:hypothetical protein SDC9_147816 [bioreactor metagenome]|uniref:Uncharacterized protein n=1 Tax=bioreactor metagenome TaxID=1076179 RepID=A0A645EH19_9ZZZZ